MIRYVASLSLFLLACAAIAPVTRADLPPLKEAAAGAKGQNFDLRLVRVGDTFQGIRFKPATGESWLIAGTKWVAIDETDKDKVPAGDYDIKMVSTDQDFTAFRFDRGTGATWQLKARKWVKIEEPQ
jgi:hypothetical protein